MHIYTRLICAWLLGCLLWAAAHAQSNIVGSGIFGDVKVTSGSSYTGPGDVVSGAKMWWGLRAYSSGDRGNRLLNVCNSTGGSDVACADMSSSASTGALVPATIGGITCPGANCTVKIAYDRSGANACSSAACDVSNTTVSTRPTLVASCIGSSSSLPCMKCSGSQFLSTGNLGGSPTLVSAPYSASAVQSRTASFTSYMAVSAFNSSPFVGYTASANSAGWITNGGQEVDIAATDSAFHAVQGTFASGTGVIYSDGSSMSASLTTGTGDISANLCNESVGTGGVPFTGSFAEVGWWPAAFTATQAGNMNSNQHTFWGF